MSELSRAPAHVYVWGVYIMICIVEARCYVVITCKLILMGMVFYTVDEEGLRG